MGTHSELHESYSKNTSANNLQRFSLTGTKYILALADFYTILITIILTTGLFQILGLYEESAGYSLLEPLFLVFLSTYTLGGVFRARNVNQIEELRQTTIATTMIFLILFAFNGMTGESNYPAGIFGLSWLIALVAVPLNRAIMRWLGTRMGVWGEPVVIIGNGNLSRRIVNYLLRKPSYGMRPVMVVDGLSNDSAAWTGKELTIPVVPLRKYPFTSEIGSQVGVNTAIIVAPELPNSISESIACGEHLGFKNIIIVNKNFNTRNFGVTPLDFGGVLGFEESPFVLKGFEDWLIRFFDLSLIFLSLPILTPIFFFISIAIKLDSKGSIFYRQTRIGKGGRVFKVLKFRTMVQDADKVLMKYLEDNPKLLAEWNECHKLKDDPRITRIGKILRKASLDELPQLWNVLKGEMSLIGPRPIVAEEIERYGDRYKYYIQVPPGLSGLWQISGRSDAGYKRRVKLDEYYVRNRSFWLNLHIIIRTFSAVLRRHGAY